MPTTFVTLDNPAGNNTDARGINDAGQIVGFYADPSGNQHGFLYSGGSFINVDDPLAGSTGTTILKGINDAGQIVGSYSDGNNHNHSFVLTITPNPPPPSGTSETFATAASSTWDAAVASTHCCSPSTAHQRWCRSTPASRPSTGCRRSAS